MSILMESPITPLLKYPGGKGRELEIISQYLPDTIDRYFEPFVGGGAIYFSISTEHKYINDKSIELMNFYTYLKTRNEEFQQKTELIAHFWDLLNVITVNHTETLINMYKRYREDRTDEKNLKAEVNEFIINNANEFNGLLDRSLNAGENNFPREAKKSLYNKMKRMKRIENKVKSREDDSDKADNNSERNYKILDDNDIILNIETSLKAALYSHLRYIYNFSSKFEISTAFYTSIYFFIREYCFSSMFRYNPKGEFNVPYGGMSYSKKNFQIKVEHIFCDRVRDHLNTTELSNLDYLEFLSRFTLKENDFIFLDPPYDTEFSTYANNEFGLTKQEELATYLKTKCTAKFLMVVKRTKNMSRLYSDGELLIGERKIHVTTFKKKYFVSFKDRNFKEVEHMIITNY